jgi:ABC-2 type transport system ATP-binding protein
VSEAAQTLNNNEVAVEISQVTKSFGSTIAVSNLSLEIMPGEIFGLIGPNGAGKTTLLRMIATLLFPEIGEIRVFGVDTFINGRDARHIIGFMPDIFGIYQDMSVEEYLHFFASTYHIPRSRRTAIIDDVLSLTDLTGKCGEMVGALSRGMQQRLSLARVLVHDPKVLLLDEPASGLDPRARVEIRELLKELGKMGKTIIVSSHILADIGDLCTRIGILENGCLKFAGTMAQLQKNIREQTVIEICVGGQLESASRILNALPSVARVEIPDGSEGEPRLFALLNETDSDPAPLVAALVNAGIPVRRVLDKQVDLEEAFMLMTDGMDAE